MELPPPPMDHTAFLTASHWPRSSRRSRSIRAVRSAPDLDTQGVPTPPTHGLAASTVRRSPRRAIHVAKRSHRAAVRQSMKPEGPTGYPQKTNRLRDTVRNMSPPLKACRNVSQDLAPGKHKIEGVLSGYQKIYKTKLGFTRLSSLTVSLWPPPPRTSSLRPENVPFTLRCVNSALGGESARSGRWALGGTPDGGHAAGG